MWDGTAPDGSHLYPAFPYPSYRHMELADVRDLFAYLKTLPPVAGKPRGPRSGVSLQHPPPARRLEASVSARRAVRARSSANRRNGIAAPIWSTVPDTAPNVTRRAISSAASSRASALPAARRRTAKSWVPNITPAGLGHWGSDKIAWSEKDIASFLGDGMNPAGDYAGGGNGRSHPATPRCSAPDDRAAIADLHRIAAAEFRGRPTAAAEESSASGAHEHRQRHCAQADLGGAVRRDVGADPLSRRPLSDRRGGVLPLGLRHRAGACVRLCLARRTCCGGAHRASARPGQPRRAQHRRHVLQFRRAGAAAVDRSQRHQLYLAADQRRARGAGAQGARAHLSLVGGDRSDFSACWWCWRRICPATN